jgi:hypothetical protein
MAANVLGWLMALMGGVGWLFAIVHADRLAGVCLGLLAVLLVLQVLCLRKAAGQ